MILLSTRLSGFQENGIITDMNKGELKNLHSFFYPTSIAIVGASSHAHKIGNVIIKNLEKSGYRGDVLLVNPAMNSHGSYRVFHHYIDIPKIPDLAIMATPALISVNLIEEIAQKGTKNILIFAAGFKEAGAEGLKLEEKLIELAKKFQLNILGPNCLGFVNYPAHLNATFGSVPRESGNIRFASQSGALATGLFDWAAATGLGFKEFVTLGNKADINENNILEYWLEEEAKIKYTPQKNSGLSPYQPIGMYLESVVAGEEFIKKAKALSRKNPIVILKPGKSAAARNAMQSHTGAMAGDDDVFEAAVDKIGAIRAEGLEDLFDLLRAFSWERAPRDNRIAIISNAGGPAVISADLLVSEGLELAKLSQRTQNILRKHLPRAAAVHNPVDVLGDASAKIYESALSAVLSEGKVDGVIIILTPQMMTEIEETAEVIVRLSRKHQKPILCSFIGGTLISQGEYVLNRARIPSFRFPERATRAFGAMWKWKKSNLKISGNAEIKLPKFSVSALKRINNYTSRIAIERKNLTAYETNEIFSEAGINVPRYALISSFAEAQEFIHHHEFPVALKIISPKVVHKTDVGGIYTNINKPEELSFAVKKLQKLALEIRKNGDDAEIMIQKFVQGGLQVILGIKTDPSFGRVLLVGAGGIFAELINEKNLAIFPLTTGSFDHIISRSKIIKILSGFRGEKYAVDKFIYLIKQICSLSVTANFPEMEINPVIVTKNDAYAIDGRIYL